MKNTKQISSLYLVSKYFKIGRRCYIHKMKIVTKCNNPAERVRQLRDKGWSIETVYEGIKKGVAVYHYSLIEKGLKVDKYR